MYERIVKCHVVALPRQALDLAEQEYRDEIVDPVEAGVRVREPTLHERRLHELTHLPFQPWCPHCVSCKSRPDHQQRVDPSDAAEREHPTIQIDLMFGITGGPILIMVDVLSRYVKAIPMKTKSAKGIAESLVTFIGELGHMQTVEVAHDNAPVVNAGVEQAKVLRNKVGLLLVDQKPKNFHKGRTAIAERSIQTVRSQAKTIMEDLRQHLEMNFGDKHVLHEWATMHASWLLIRFHRHTTLKSTAYQQLHGRPYRGRVTSFGSLCYGLDGTISKHHPSWLAAVWQGKDISDHHILAVGNEKLIRCRAVRQADKMWDKERLVGLTIGPADLLKIATHSKVKLLPASPPPVMPVRDGGDGTADEAASDPPSPTTVQGDEGRERTEDQGVPDGDVAGDELDVLFADEEFEQQPTKRSLEGATGPVGSKSAKTEAREKHGLDDVKEREVTKQPRLDLSTSSSVPPTTSGLQSSPMHAANIRRVSTYGGLISTWKQMKEEKNLSFILKTYLRGWVQSKRMVLRMRKMAHLKWMKVFSKP